MTWSKITAGAMGVVMANPFEKRATEYLRDNAAFLLVVAPEPLHTFFEKPATAGSLYDRLCMVIGTPGSGKTTIATLLQYGSVHTLLNSPNHTDYRALQKALISCKVVEPDKILVLGCRIPMESEYREFWELPYSETIKFGLLKSFLQSRTVISWLNSLRSTYSLKDIKIAYREGADVVQETIGGDNAEKVLQQAKHVERAIYSVCAALVPPKEAQLPELSTAPYHPFDAIQEIMIPEGEGYRALTPLVMLDDVHSLHPEQLFRMRDWLAKREMRIARWMLMRLDAQTPEAVITGISANAAVDADSTIKKSREITPIWLQSGSDIDRGTSRKKFRVMAKSMAEKYLRLMPVFSRLGMFKLQDILNTQPAEISDSNYQKLVEKVKSFEARSGISPTIRKDLEHQIEAYNSGISTIKLGRDEKLAMLYIMLNRYVKRVPQAGLFDTESPAEPSKPIVADSGIADGARIFLLHEYGRAYYYGIDAICDGSAENAEQFLQLASRLVSASEARIVRGDPSGLPSAYQHKLLTEKANEVVREWIFPRHVEVKKLCLSIADECKKKSLEPNASLGGGANAFGIPDEAFDDLAIKQSELAHVLKFGVAYGALSIKRHHGTKKRLWTLIELTGPFLITQGLTLSRGGFLEKQLNDLLIPLREE